MISALFLLVAMVTAAKAQTCPPLPSSAPGPNQLTLTADFLYFLYVDGELMDELPGYDNVTAPNTFDLPDYARLLAIQGQAFMQHGGIIASIQPNDYFLTGDIGWRCRNTPQGGWENLGFDDSSWATAHVIGPNGAYPGVDHGCIEGISPNAYWIWTANYGSPAPLDRNVWCRGYIPLCTKNNPCQNGGVCLPNTAGKVCSCPIDFSGQLCEIG